MGNGSVGLFAVSGWVLLTACVGSFPSQNEARLGTAPARQAAVSGAVVLGAEQLWGRGGNLLGLIASHVSSMSVRGSSHCPEVVLRGRKSVAGPTDPGVYVNGARAGNTCILETIPPDEVERVEVYPMGVTQRPGYRSNSNGLILIFMRGARDRDSTN